MKYLRGFMESPNSKFALYDNKNGVLGPIGSYSKYLRLAQGWFLFHCLITEICGLKNNIALVFWEQIIFFFFWLWIIKKNPYNLKNIILVSKNKVLRQF